MSGLGVLLRLPIQGVSIGAVLGPSLLLRALAAAVIGRMESLPRTLGAALVLGMIEQAVLFETGRTIIVDAVLFFIILGALLLQRRGSGSRAEDVSIGFMPCPEGLAAATPASRGTARARSRS